MFVLFVCLLILVLLSTLRPAHFMWMEIAAQSLAFKVGELEPVFCSLTLYRIMSRLGKKGAEVDLSRSGRVSETFWRVQASVVDDKHIFPFQYIYLYIPFIFTVSVLQVD